MKCSPMSQDDFDSICEKNLVLWFKSKEDEQGRSGICGDMDIVQRSGQRVRCFAYIQKSNWTLRDDNKPRRAIYCFKPITTTFDPSAGIGTSFSFYDCMPLSNN
jgi:hypothetical protein